MRRLWPIIALLLAVGGKLLADAHEKQAKPCPRVGTPIFLGLAGPHGEILPLRDPATFTPPVLVFWDSTCSQ